METDNVPLVICGVLTFVVLLNAGLLIGILRGRNRERFNVIGKAISAAQNPWREQDEQYDELRRRVTDLGDNEVED
jgi:hypothetical protein